jgi:competence protein ComFB
MPLTDTYNFEHLKNQAENLVLDELEIQLAQESEETCRCNDCIVDMAAMALNNVKPLYRFSILGTLYAAQAKNEPAYADTVKHAVAKAIEKVASNPSHDKKQIEQEQEQKQEQAEDKALS